MITIGSISITGSDIPQAVAVVAVIANAAAAAREIFFLISP